MSRRPLPPLIPVAAALAAVAAPASAQTAAGSILDAFSSGGDPLSNAFLSRIFGCRLFPGISGCEALPAPVFAEAIGLFNSFCLALGVALFAWNASVGIMQTAHEGQVLGQRWSSLWAPIRTLAAAAMLTPLPGLDGYNTIQASIAWLVRGSTAAASIIWAGAASLVLHHQAPVTSPAVMFDQHVIGAAWRMASCQSVVQQIAAEATPEGGRGPVVALDYQSPDNPPPVNSIAPDDLPSGPSGGRAAPPRFGTSAPNLNFAVCGVIHLPRPPEIVYRSGRDSAWYESHRGALRLLLLEIRQISGAMIALELVDPGTLAAAVTENTARRIVAAGMRYQQALALAMPGLAETSRIASDAGGGRLSEPARERIDLIISGSWSETCRTGAAAADDWLNWICESGDAGQGWLGAGSWYVHMSRFANEAQTLFHARPQADDSADLGTAAAAGGREARRAAGGWHQWLSGSGTSRRMAARAADLALGIERRWNEAALRAAQSGAPVDSRLIQGGFASEGLPPGAGASPRPMPNDAVRNWMASKTREWFLPPATADPMAALAEFGNAQLAWGLGLIAGGKAAEWAGGLAGALPFGDIIAGLGQAAAIVGGALMVSGAFLAFILPMLPFLLWIAAVTGYFILIAEAVIACNLWAVAHLRLDGEGLAGEAARQGYYLVLALTLTPVLMVFGFLLGMGIFKVTSTLLGLGLEAALRGLAHDQSWAVWLIGMAVVSIILVAVYVVLAERSFSLVAELPGKVLRWVGADADVASREDDRIRAAAMAGGAAIMGAGGKVGQIERIRKTGFSG